MKPTIHRGTHEIGGNCVEISSDTDRSRIILDVGMPLFDLDGNPHDTAALRKKPKQELLEAGILPRIPGLFENGSQPDAILLSHAHEDHTGLIRHSHPDIPIYASRGTSKLMEAGAKFAQQPRLSKRCYRQLDSQTTAKSDRRGMKKLRVTDTGNDPPVSNSRTIVNHE